MQKAIFFTIILGLLLFSCKKENKEAIESYNKRISENGLFSDGLRSF